MRGVREIKCHLISLADFVLKNLLRQLRASLLRNLWTSPKKTSLYIEYLLRSGKELILPTVHNEFDQYILEGLAQVSQEAFKREDYDTREPLIRALTHISFLEEMLDLESMNMIPHLLKTRDASIKFYPRSFQRFCAWIKLQESPHFAINAESYKGYPQSLPFVQIWKKSRESELYVPAFAEEVIDLEKLGYHQDLVTYFGSRTLPQIVDTLHDQVIGILSRPNKLAQLAERTG